MRGVHVLAGIASTGLLGASLVLGAPASARDVVNGTGGDDHLRGTPFTDTIRGFGGNDVVQALPGGDLIGGGWGLDEVYAGPGDDTARGGPQGDYLNGGRGDDSLYGGAGFDGITGFVGSDVIFGGAMGDGFLFDGAGADTIHGGLGNDTVYLAVDGSLDIVICGPGHDAVWGATSENTVAADCETVHVQQPPCGRGTPQRVPPPLREAAPCK
jgi:Ca2+-binding RTX toxin-like protein